MFAQQRKARAGVIELADLMPGRQRVAGDTAQRLAVGPRLRHALAELSAMRVAVTSRAGPVGKAESGHILRSLRLVALAARDRQVGPG
jgi:hypothetical protein